MFDAFQTSPALAITGAGLLGLVVGSFLNVVMLRLPPREGRARARLFAAGAVLRQRSLEDGGIELEVSLRRHELERICREDGVELPTANAPCADERRFLQSNESLATRGVA